MRRLVGSTVALLALLAALVLLAWGLGAVELPGEDVHDEATVTFVAPDGTTLTTVQARVADTRKERIRGLAGADSLENGSGMLFVHPRVGTHGYVMRDVSFPLDIIFVAPCEEHCPGGVDGQVTTIDEADVPSPDEQSPTFEGRGKWVLEVPQGYAAAHDVGEGDSVRITYGNATGG
jgi:uncharacterized membrane protein (UPF0127 family)